MAIAFQSRYKSIRLLMGALVVAVGLWGAYAWRATHTSTEGPSTDSRLAGSKRPESKLTPLSATRPISDIIKKIESEKPTERPAPDFTTPDAVVTEAALSSVRANAAPAEQQAVEMAIGEKPSTNVDRPLLASSTTDLELGRAALARGDVIDARTLLSSALGRDLPTAEEDSIRVDLTRLSDALLFSRATNTNDPLTSVHTITAGDTLHVLAAKHGITEELLASINKITEPNRLHVGQRIKLIKGPFRVVIDKSEHRMDVFLGDLYVRSFPVGLGSNGYTPTGEWVVNNKLRNPDWTDPNTNRHFLADEPDNPIGERWIGLSGVKGDALGKGGFGIHGTIDPDSIGRDKSMGCVRLKPADVNLVYDLLVHNESRVVIRP